ncbi:MAG: FAD-dependent oxidoreductase [Propionicimonas sp.]
MPEPIIIVGASLGGLRTAEALRRFGYDGAITVIGDEPHPPYNRPPLSKEVLAAGVSHEAVAFPRRAAISDVEWVLGRRIVSADLAGRTVTDDTGHARRYSSLVIATGLRPRRLPHPQPIAGRHVLRTLDDALALREALLPGARVVIAGSGFIGCEVAATARGLGCEVTVVDVVELPLLRALGQDLAERLRRRHLDAGVRFELGVQVVGLLGSERITGVELSNGVKLPCDVLIEAVGSEYNTGWLADQDLQLGEGVRTDGALRALRRDGEPWPDVHAVGDVACFPNPRFGGLARTVQHWNIPTETGRRAGQLIALRHTDEAGWAELVAQPFAPVPSFWTDQYELHLLAYGLPDLADEIDLLDGTADGDCVVGYFRDELLVGVCGVGAKTSLHRYRSLIGGPKTALTESAQR